MSRVSIHIRYLYSKFSALAAVELYQIEPSGAWKYFVNVVQQSVAENQDSPVTKCITQPILLPAAMAA